ncbi:uroporphyrinogen-III synthase [Malassezia equina]|uniref:Uroporphyrinogen-III synthase n=1 Tax=Malassezia equina TaxID=1381935 RepID=A0AAF0IYJ4_9BASI|nr:uroporphyrinogen-III synthase [Malassezia equina]
MPGRAGPITVLLLRQPVSMLEGTDAYHDAFGSFCLPSFAVSALDSGSSASGTPIANDLEPLRAAHSPSHPPPSTPHNLEDLSSSPMNNKGYLMTHHMANLHDDESADADDREFCITSFPILSHGTRHVDILAQKIRNALQEGEVYDGVVITSQRAVQAWQEACSLVSADVVLQQTLRMSKQWSQTPFYVVGPATDKSLRQIPVHPALRPKIVFGEQAGNAKGLAHEMAFHASRSPSVQKMLYLVGDKRQPMLRDTLEALHANIELDELMVYITEKDPNFKSNCGLLARDLPQHISGNVGSVQGHSPRSRMIHTLKMTDRSLPATEGEQEIHPDWVVFFSPSGGDYALPELTRRGWLTPNDPAKNLCKIACIGQTTATWVNNTLGYAPDAIAARPTPEALRNAIVNQMRNHWVS